MDLTPRTLMDIQLAAHEDMKNCLNEDRNYMNQRLADAAHHLYCLAAIGGDVLPAPEDARPAQYDA